MPAQIVEKSGEGLSRVYNITVPANDLVTKLEAKIAEIAPKMQLKGFRPGKVPPAHVKRMYGKDLMGEIVQETLTETNDKIFNDNNIRPAGQPELKAESDMDAVIAGKADLTYELAVELIPDSELIDASKIKRELGWEPKHKFEEAIKTTIQWYRDNEKWWRSIKNGEYLKYYEMQYVSR